MKGELKNSRYIQIFLVWILAVIFVYMFTDLPSYNEYILTIIVIALFVGTISTLLIIDSD